MRLRKRRERRPSEMSRPDGRRFPSFEGGGRSLGVVDVSPALALG